MDTIVNANIDDLGIKESIKVDLSNGFKATLQELIQRYGNELTNLSIEFGEIEGFIFEYSAIHKSRSSKAHNTTTGYNPHVNKEPSNGHDLTPTSKAGRWLYGIMKSLNNLLQKFDYTEDMLPYLSQKRQDFLANNLVHLIECAQGVLKKINR